jgi:hypothetical protein
MCVSKHGLDLFLLACACCLCIVPNGLTFVDGGVDVNWKQFSTPSNIGRVESTSTFASTIFLAIIFSLKENVVAL